MLKHSAIIIAAILFSLLCIDRMPQIVTIAALVAGGVYFINRKVEKGIRRKIILLFLVSFFLQVVISLFLYSQTLETKYYGFSYKGDDYIYGDFGTIVGDLWRKGIFPSLKKLRYYNLIGKNVALQKYQLYNALIFYLFGGCGGQILLIINCFFHAIIILPVYFICKDLDIGDNITAFICFLFLFWPSVFYWTLFNFKDPMLLLAVFSAFALLSKINTSLPVGRFLALVFAIFVIYLLRVYVFFIFVCVIFFYFLFMYRWSKREAALLLIFSSLFLIKQLLTKPIFSSLHRIISIFPLSTFNVRYWGVMTATTGYFKGLWTYTYPKMLLFLPFGILGVLFLPFSLIPLSVKQIIANMESIIWWCLMPFLIGGIWIAVKTEFKKTFAPLVTFFCWLGLLALTTGSMGTLIRHKSVIYYVGFVFIALAIDRASGEKAYRGREK